MKVTYSVICFKDKQHEFVVVYDLVEGTEDVESRPTERCPFCGTPIEVTVHGKLKEDVIVRRRG